MTRKKKAAAAGGKDDAKKTAVKQAAAEKTEKKAGKAEKTPAKAQAPAAKKDDKKTEAAKKAEATPVKAAKAEVKAEAKPESKTEKAKAAEKAAKETKKAPEKAAPKASENPDKTADKETKASEKAEKKPRKKRKMHLKTRIRREVKRCLKDRTRVMFWVVFGLLLVFFGVALKQTFGDVIADMGGLTKVFVPIKQDAVVLYHTADRSTEYLNLEDYIVGVVAAEMPAAYGDTALKAQAVVARTYTANCVENKTTEYPRKADVTDNPGTCQAYISKEDYLAKNGENAEQYYQMIVDAVNETKGQVLTYDGKIIASYYSASCGGKTAAPEDVWGAPKDGLQSVECGYCSTEITKHFYSYGTIAARLGLKELANINNYTFAVTDRAASGRVKQIVVGGFNGTAFTGMEFMSKLGLNSAWFEIHPVASGVWIWSHGNGHGVGMCQEGAHGMAEAGIDYEDILKHYYTGVELARISN